MTKGNDLDNKVTELVGQEHIFKDKSELGEVMDNLDSDIVDDTTKMSSIDFNARLSSQEVGACLVIDELTRIGILPKTMGLTRQKKRLSVSLEGRGREEKVRIVAGERENKQGGGFMTKLTGLFSRRD